MDKEVENADGTKDDLAGRSEKDGKAEKSRNKRRHRKKKDRHERGTAAESQYGTEFVREYDCAETKESRHGQRGNISAAIDDKEVENADGTKDDLAGRSEKDGKAEKSRNKRRHRKKKDRHERGTAAESQYGTEFVREYDCAETKESRHGQRGGSRDRS
ncbi:hypothetical protein MTO96_027972 [Rhipicephalus appendiculatus]